jgi:hypothetical protein
MTLIDWINSCDHNYDENGFSDKIHSLNVVKKIASHQKSFPQTKNTHRYIHVWVLLEDGSAVGWNESPRTGYSFPRAGKKTVKKFYPNI